MSCLESELDLALAVGGLRKDGRVLAGDEARLARIELRGASVFERLVLLTEADERVLTLAVSALDHLDELAVVSQDVLACGVGGILSRLLL